MNKRTRHGVEYFPKSSAAHNRRGGTSVNIVQVHKCSEAYCPNGRLTDAKVCRFYIPRALPQGLILTRKFNPVFFTFHSARSDTGSTTTIAALLAPGFQIMTISSPTLQSMPARPRFAVRHTETLPRPCWLQSRWAADLLKHDYRPRPLPRKLFALCSPCMANTLLNGYQGYELLPMAYDRRPS